MSDFPPVALDWDVGTDLPIGWKNGVACRFGGQVVVAGGLFEGSAVWLAKYDSLLGFRISTSPNTAPALLYDLKLRTWAPIESPPVSYPDTNAHRRNESARAHVRLHIRVLCLSSSPGGPKAPAAPLPAPRPCSS